MSQQRPSKTNDDIYKRKLFYDNGIKFIPVKARMLREYKPPTPVLKSSINMNLQSSAGLVSQGTSYYTATLRLYFTSKHEYADWMQYIGSTHKYYDEKGTIYIGVVTGDIATETVEFETKYIVTVNLSLIRKQDYEFRHKYPFVDIDNHWAKEYIDDLQQLGMITTYAYDGSEVQYFRPEAWITRAEVTAFLTRAYKHIEKVLRGY